MCISISDTVHLLWSYSTLLLIFLIWLFIIQTVFVSTTLDYALLKEQTENMSIQNNSLFIMQTCFYLFFVCLFCHLALVTNPGLLIPWLRLMDLPPLPLLELNVSARSNMHHICSQVFPQSIAQKEMMSPPNSKGSKRENMPGWDWRVFLFHWLPIILASTSPI